MKYPWSRSPVLSEHLAVVTGDDDPRRVHEAELFELVHDLADTVVGESDLTSIEIVGETRSEGLGRIVVVVRIVVMEEQEKVFVSVIFEPLPRQSRRLITFPLAQEKYLVLLFETVVIGIEALAQVEFRVKDEAADDGPRRVAPLSQHFGQGHVRVGEAITEVIVHAVDRRDGSRQHRAMRGQSRGDGGDHVFEEHALSRDVIDVRRRLPWEAVARQVVGPQRIDADEENVLGLRAVAGTARAPLRARPPPAEGSVDSRMSRPRLMIEPGVRHEQVS